ncbi:MAG TPA: hypothetical protein VIH57_06890 [Bacteroidales bacterium]
MLRKILLSSQLLILTACILFSQTPSELRDIQVSFYKNRIDSLCSNYADNKNLNPTFELQTLIALSYYPELKGTKVRFIRKSINTTAACRPTWTFLFKRRNQRVYKIYINNDPEKIKGAMLEEIPFDAQIGLIGHELGHIVDYSGTSALGIIATGFRYLFISGRAKVEKRVDNITIAHHLGWQLYDFDDFIFNRSKVSRDYKDYKRRVYYKPEELLQLIGQK